MPNPASVEDVEARMPRALTDQERNNASIFLEDAWWMLQGRRVSLVDDIATGAVLEQNVARVLAWMVVRVLKNPEGYDSESIDDWTGRRNALMASGVLHVTPAELGDVTPRAGVSRGSVRLVVYGDA